jgi:hypothetical protein
MGLIISMVLLIGAAVLGIDKGVLRNMSTPEYARGLITYLFAVMTIGTAVVLVLSTLITPPQSTTPTQLDQIKDQFTRGKEILSLLLGVFGTIVGYYFGSTIATPAAELRLSHPRVTSIITDAGPAVLVQSTVAGGSPPYLFGIAVGDSKPETVEPVAEDGWIVREVALPAGASSSAVAIRVSVQDATGKRIEKIAMAPASGTPNLKTVKV